MNIISSHTAIARMPHDSVVFLQYPMQYNLKKLFNAAKRRNNKIVLLIHDLNFLRGISDYNYPELLQSADVLIAHTPEMKKIVQEKFNNQNVIELGIFDYLMGKSCAEEVGKIEKDKWHIVFAGNLTKAQ